jgi:hypothetical protein
LHSIYEGVKAGAAHLTYLHKFSALKTAADRYVNTPNNVSIDAYGNADAVLQRLKLYPLSQAANPAADDLRRRQRRVVRQHHPLRRELLRVAQPTPSVSRDVQFHASSVLV